MDRKHESSRSEDLKSPNSLVTKKPTPHPLMAPISMSRNEDNDLVQRSASQPLPASGYTNVNLSSNADSAPSTPRISRTRTPQTPWTPQSTPSSRSSHTSAVNAANRRSSEGITEGESQGSSIFFPRHISSSPAKGHLESPNQESDLHRSSSGSFQLTQSDRKRSAPSLHPSKRRRSNQQSAQNISQPVIPGISTKRPSRKLTRSLSLGSPHLYESSNHPEPQRPDKAGMLALNFSVQGHDVWGKSQTEDYVLELDIDQIKRSLDMYDKLFKGASLGDFDSIFDNQNLEVRGLVTAPEPYLQSAFAAICGLVSVLKRRNHRLVHDLEILEDKIESLEAGPETPTSLHDDTNNHIIVQLQETVQNLKSEIAKLKFGQHELASPDGRSAQENEELDRKFRDNYLQLLPAPEPVQKNAKRWSVILDQCREEERDRYEKKLDIARQGISYRQQKLDALTSKHEQDLSELQDQLRSQQQERLALIQDIRTLQDEQNMHGGMLPAAAREHEYLQQKYDALDLKYGEVKKQRNDAMDIGRQANEELKGLLLQQVQSQVKLQLVFEQSMLFKHGRRPRIRDEMVPDSLTSEDIMANLRHRNQPLRSPSVLSSSVAHPTGRKPRPAPIMLGKPPRPLPEIERHQTSEPELSGASTMLKSIDMINNIPPGSPGEALWRDAVANSRGRGPPGLTPLFASYDFQKRHLQPAQLARVVFEIISMDQNRHYYTFSEYETVYVYPGLGDFWPVERYDSEPTSDLVFALPKTAIVLICDHFHPYEDYYKITQKWNPGRHGDVYVALENAGKDLFSFAQCAHTEVFEHDGELEEYGCLLLHNGHRGYAPLSHLEPVRSSQDNGKMIQCPCADSKPYTRSGVILKDTLSELEGVTFRQGDAVQIAHVNSAGEYCVRLKRNGIVGFVHAVNLRIYDSSMGVLVEAAWSPLGTKTEPVWDNNIHGNNPQYLRKSQLDSKRERLYYNWIDGPPAGNYFVEKADFEKLPKLWKDVLTMNPPDHAKGPKRVRAKSMIPQARATKHSSKRHFQKTHQPKVDPADGNTALALLNGSDEDPGYMSEPTPTEMHRRRAHFVFEPGKSPVDIDTYKVDEDEDIMTFLAEVGEGELLNHNHRSEGFLDAAGLRALELYKAKKGVHDDEAAAIRTLLKWQRTGDAVAYALRPGSMFKSKSGFDDTDLFTIEDIQTRKAPNQSALMVTHRDRHGNRKDDAKHFIRVHELAYEDPWIPTRLLKAPGTAQGVATAILLGRMENREDWKCVIIGDGTAAHLNELRYLRLPGEATPFNYVPLRDILHIIQDAERRSGFRGYQGSPLPEINDTVRKLYDIHYQPDSKNEIGQSDQHRPSEKDNRDLKVTDHQAAARTQVLQPENLTPFAGKSESTQENAAKPALKSRLEESIAELKRENAEIKQQQALIQEKVKSLTDELGAEKRARLELERQQLLDEIPWQYKMIGKETEAQAQHLSRPDSHDFRPDADLRDSHESGTKDMDLNGESKVQERKQDLENWKAKEHSAETLRLNSKPSKSEGGVSASLDRHLWDVLPFPWQEEDFTETHQGKEEAPNWLVKEDVKPPLWSPYQDALPLYDQIQTADKHYHKHYTLNLQYNMPPQLPATGFNVADVKDLVLELDSGATQIFSASRKPGFSEEVTSFPLDQNRFTDVSDESDDGRFSDVMSLEPESESELLESEPLENDPEEENEDHEDGQKREYHALNRVKQIIQETDWARFVGSVGQIVTHLYVAA